MKPLEIYVETIAQYDLFEKNFITGSCLATVQGYRQDFPKKGARSSINRNLHLVKIGHRLNTVMSLVHALCCSIGESDKCAFCDDDIIH